MAKGKKTQQPGTDKKIRPGATVVQELVKAPAGQPSLVERTGPILENVAQYCDDCRATGAFQAWRSSDLGPSFNTMIDFANWEIVPAGKRAVIELVTAQILVPAGERARLRMFTSLGSVPSNLDLLLTPQGAVSGRDVLVATHSLRAYTDGMIRFNINRDNAQTEGHALICISGYLAD